MKAYPAFKTVPGILCAALVLSSCGAIGRITGNNQQVADLPLPAVPSTVQPPLQPALPSTPTIGGLTGNRAAVLNNLLRQGSIGPYSVGLPYTYESQRYVPREDLAYREAGLASWYGPGLAGQPTSNGEKFNPQAHTAAHKTLPFSTILKVTNPATGKATLVRINDRGPFLPDHIIDLSQRAARDLGIFTSQGTQILMEVLEPETRAVAQATGGTIGLSPVANTALASAPATSTIPTTFQPTPVQDLSTPTPSTGISSNGLLPPAASPGQVTTGLLPPLPGANTSSVGLQVAQPVPVPQPQALPASAIPVLPPLPATQPTVAQPVAPVVLQPPLPQAPVATTSSATSSSAPAASASGFYVQAGSYSSRENAEQVRNKLNGVGNVVIFPVNVSGKQMYRVRVGPYQTRQQARAKLGTVIVSGGPDAIVIQEG